MRYVCRIGSRDGCPPSSPHLGPEASLGAGVGEARLTGPCGSPSSVCCPFMAPLIELSGSPELPGVQPPDPGVHRTHPAEQETGCCEVGCRGVPPLPNAWAMGPLSLGTCYWLSHIAGLSWCAVACGHGGSWYPRSLQPAVKAWGMSWERGAGQALPLAAGEAPLPSPAVLLCVCICIWGFPEGGSVEVPSALRSLQLWAAGYSLRSGASCAQPLGLYLGGQGQPIQGVPCQTWHKS